MRSINLNQHNDLHPKFSKNPKKPRKIFDNHDGISYAFCLDFLPINYARLAFGRRYEYCKHIGQWNKEAKCDHVDTKCIPIKKGIKKWLAFNDPAFWYADWEEDVEGYGDHSIKIYYLLK